MQSSFEERMKTMKKREEVRREIIAMDLLSKNIYSNRPKSSVPVSQAMRMACVKKVIERPEDEMSNLSEDDMQNCLPPQRNGK